jgi:branched-subunit amino acid transport protein AzlD
MALTSFEAFIIVAMVVLGTVITRFLPFLLFAWKKDKHPFITYLGNVLPYAAIGFLVVYCLKGVNLTNPSLWLPAAVATICITVLHVWKGNVLLSIGTGTVIYMVLVQMVFH